MKLINAYCASVKKSSVFLQKAYIFVKILYLVICHWQLLCYRLILHLMMLMLQKKEHLLLSLGAGNCKVGNP